METVSFIDLLKKIDDFNSKLLLNDDKEVINELMITYIKRFYSFSNTLLSLVPNLDKNKYSIISVGIILRTCMSDLITFYYLFNLTKTKPNEYENEIRRFMADNLEHLYKKDITKIEDKDEKNELISIMKIKWSEYFEEGQDTIIKPLKKSISEMAKELMKDGDSPFKVAYNIYNYLSKFEHIGKLTIELQEYHERDPNKNLKQVLVTYGLYLDGFISILDNFNLSNQVKSELNEIIESAKKIKLLPLTVS